MRVGVLVLAAGCYAPKLVPGSPCDMAPCPSGLVCEPMSLTCQFPGDAVVSMPDAPVDGRLIDGCTPAPEECGDGIDQNCDGNDPPCPANDAPDGAIDVTAGGTFTADLSAAHDDGPQTGCSADGGRDVFYKVTLAKAEVYYFDTFGSSFGTILRVYPGKACMAFGQTTPTCSRNSCGGDKSQLAMSLPSGTSCIIVDQHATDTTGALSLKVKRGGRDGALLGSGVKTYNGTSCSGVNATMPNDTCVMGDSKTSEDVGYYFTVCPQQTLTLDASTCGDSTMTHFDTVMYLRPVGTTNDLACNDDTSTCVARTERPDKPDGSTFANIAATGPNLFWLTVDGYGGACGGYRLDTNLR